MQTNSTKDKTLDDSLEAIIQKVQRIKGNIGTLLMRLEQEYMTINWPNVLDSFALILSEISSLTNLLKPKRVAAPINLKNFAFFPTKLSQDCDPELQNLTEGRVPIFNHDIGPVYLRTKPLPEIEDKLTQMQAKAANTSQDNLNKQVNLMNKMLQLVQEAIKNHRDSAESDFVQKSSIAQLSSQADTNLLISAITFGKGLKSNQSSGHPPIQDQRMAMPQTPQVMLETKAPSTVRTTVKAASNIHPYPR